MRRGLVVAALGAVWLGGAPAQARVDVLITNVDEPGVGLNETTPARPVGGNLGTTLGQQRLDVFREAARIWGEALDSDVPIEIQASFAPLQCSATEGVLGAARPAAYLTFAGAPRANTSYVRAEASRLAGTSLGSPDFIVQFSASLDQKDCLGGVGWYYGFDHRHGAKRDLLVAALHEFAHGLGFISLTDENFEYEPSTVDVWSSYLFDPVTQSPWKALTSAQREASATSGVLTWSGPAVTALAPSLLDARGAMRVTDAPSAPALVKDYEVAEASFGAAIPAQGLSAPLTVFPAPDAGCSPSPRPVDGQVALIDRGACLFVDKAAHAQDAGAIGVVIVNNVTGLIAPGGDRPDITIPVLGLSKADGAALRAALAGGGAVSVSLFKDPNLLAGLRDGGVLMYAPNPFEPGSSVSHWATSARPNLLMEPFMSDELDGGLDLTLALMRDLDWFKTDLSLTGTAPETVSRGQRVSVTLEVTNTSPSPSEPVTLSLEGVNLTVEGNAGDCVTAFPCELGALPAKAQRRVTTTLTSGTSGAPPSARFTVASPSNYNADNDSFTLRVSGAPGCGCSAEGGPWLGLAGLGWLWWRGARTRPSRRRRS